MKTSILFLAAFIFSVLAQAQTKPLYSLTCVEASQKIHSLEIYIGYVYLDGEIFLYKDDQSNLPGQHNSRETHTLYNNDDLDLVLPNSFLLGQFNQGNPVLFDYQEQENHELRCSPNTP